MSLLTKLPRWLAGAFLLLSVPAAADTVLLADNPGGSVVKFEASFTELAASGDNVIVAGYCASACTLITHYLPNDRVCVAPGAWFGFHSAFTEDDDTGERTFAPEGTAEVWGLYPDRIKHMLRARGWDGASEHPDLIVINGDKLYKPCDTVKDMGKSVFPYDPNGPIVEQPPIPPRPVPVATHVAPKVVHPAPTTKAPAPPVAAPVCPPPPAPVVVTVPAPAPAAKVEAKPTDETPLWLDFLYFMAVGAALTLMGKGAYSIYQSWKGTSK